MKEPNLIRHGFTSFPVIRRDEQEENLLEAEYVHER